MTIRDCVRVSIDVHNVDSWVVKEINCVTYIIFYGTVFKCKVSEQKEELEKLLLRLSLETPTVCEVESVENVIDSQETVC